MGWGTDCKVDIYLNKQIFNFKSEVEDKIHELEQDIAKQETMLISYACANPKDIAGDEWKDEPIRNINFIMDEALETYKEDLYNKFQLELYLGYLEDNNIEQIPAQE